MKFPQPTIVPRDSPPVKSPENDAPTTWSKIAYCTECPRVSGALTAEVAVYLEFEHLKILKS